ncbi:MAG: S-methyl-5-thioribose-1-phosphate isomerase [Syntrophales bacterium]|nr:S-methyl-5-thioribose-1-phosphate isomerase [Syntrophales bacterium]MDD5232592.1 S-methyl-5-thioribose-1-phosphate isomerase [Syntrophales bacterium]MDD5531304.1 S-methyl-5-thioribose-1-phosphate isomerase [Syntrophales bacterium]
MIRTVFWDRGAVSLIDQKALPNEEKYLVCRDYREVCAAIRDLTVRGAPAIGVAAAMGIALGVSSLPQNKPVEMRRAFNSICGEFAATRPTARNLFWAIERMKRRFEELSGQPVEAMKSGLIAEAIRICEEDIEINRKIGLHGRALVRSGDRILTHCNAGALATAGYGTALGVIRAAHEEGKRIEVYVDETRPVLQGARLTAWELAREKIPATLITDSMAGFLMQQGRIDLVVVGADRIAANGDTANKIGTYSLAVLARSHRIPFYIAAPLSTFDPSLRSGGEIPIEERAAGEVTACGGVRTAPEGVAVYNPAFDLTPGRYITAIITEEGIIRKPFRQAIGRIMRSPSPLPLSRGGRGNLSESDA